jgi:hypothetical protein
MTPTENAEREFRSAVSHVVALSGSGQAGSALAPSLVGLMQGLGFMAVALRAIYIKLEEVEAVIKRQPGARP